MLSADDTFNVSGSPIFLIFSININSFLPLEIQKYASDNNARYFQIGTDCVFSGKDGNYNEKNLILIFP